MATVDDHTCSMGQDMMEMGMKWNMMMEWNMMMRMRNHVHSVCTILHMHKVRGGCVGLMGDIPVVFYSSITKMKIKMIKLDPCKAWDPI